MLLFAQQPRSIDDFHRPLRSGRLPKSRECGSGGPFASSSRPSRPSGSDPDPPDAREVWSLKGHTLPVIDVAFSPDGLRLATAAADRTVRLWDLTAGQEILKLVDSGNVDSVRFVSDGRLIGATHDRRIRVWDATPLPESSCGAGSLRCWPVGAPPLFGRSVVMKAVVSYRNPGASRSRTAH